MSEQTKQKISQWLEPSSLSPGLYLVGTPIGNLRDISLRALDVLVSADVVYCEDTRVTRKLLKAYSIKTSLKVYNDHSDDKARRGITASIQDGKSVALLSDAGLPLIADPGYKLVQDCHSLDLAVTTIPGPNAALSALQISGLPTDQFCFLGFLPSKQEARKRFLESWVSCPATLVCYETAPRLLNSLRDIKDLYKNRYVSLAREITKYFEEVRHAPVCELIDFYEQNDLPKGELVLVIAPGDAQEYSEDDLDRLLKQALETMKVKEAASTVSEITGHSKKELYERVLRIKSS